MDAENLQDRVVEIDEQWKRLRNLISSIQLYLYIQLIIVISSLSLPWLYECQKKSIFYLISRLLQYSFHLFSIIKIKKSVEIIYEDIRQLVQIFNQQVNIWSAVISNHEGLKKCNELIYIIMFIVGNAVFLQNNLLLSKWILVIQLIIGWIAVGLTDLVLFFICLMLPCLICRINRQRQEQINRADLLIGTQIKYSDLDSPNTQPCYICLQNYSNDDLIVKLSCNPNHVFHSNCIQPWAQIHDTCPVCRQRFQQQ
ncbi:unnamed protein product [Paramecium sonneborni]|uniref:RING-type domain-containing protein n=1 Tax=Paramecium sonneborni TaxID=65129 RepID=A0A8S1RQH7_9CILI|nr:unnamed protein product [Paramecium sonneborni]